MKLTADSGNVPAEIGDKIQNMPKTQNPKPNRITTSRFMTEVITIPYNISRELFRFEWNPRDPPLEIITISDLISFGFDFQFLESITAFV